MAKIRDRQREPRHTRGQEGRRAGRPILARRKKAIYKDDDGREWIWMPGGRGHSKNKKKYLDEIMGEGKALDDVWDLRIVTSSANERTGYATQKPETLLHRIVDGCSREGDLVADFFCGSGTTLAVAEKLGRRWIGCDLGRWGIHVTRKRLLGIEDCKPFEVLSLGEYEHQFWQGRPSARRGTTARRAGALRIPRLHPQALRRAAGGGHGAPAREEEGPEAPAPADSARSDGAAGRRQGRRALLRAGLPMLLARTRWPCGSTTAPASKSTSVLPWKVSCSARSAIRPSSTRSSSTRHMAQRGRVPVPHQP